MEHLGYGSTSFFSGWDLPMNMLCSDGELHCNGQTQPYIADISSSIPMMVAYRSCFRNPFTLIENHRSYMNCRWIYQCISSMSRSYTSYIKYVKHKPQFYRCSPSKIPSMPSYTWTLQALAKAWWRRTSVPKICWWMYMYVIVYIYDVIYSIS